MFFELVKSSLVTFKQVLSYLYGIFKICSCILGLCQLHVYILLR